MRERDVTRKINKSLRKYGFWPVTQTDAVKCGKCGNLFYPKKGRPDILCLHPKRESTVVEVKVLKNKNCFSMNLIDEKQREWLSRWYEDGGLGYIGLGVIETHGKVDRLEALCLIEWPEWLELESELEGILKCVPWDAEKAGRVAVREQGIGIKQRLPHCCLIHTKGDIWTFSYAHSLLRR
jgi:hypothetical protein